MFFNRYKLLIISVINCCFTFNVIANEFKDQQNSEQYVTASKHVPQYPAEAVQSKRIKRKIFKSQQDDQESNKNTSWYTKFSSWLPSSNCLKFNKKPNRQLVYCVLAGTTLLLIDYASAQSASTASNAPPPPPASSSSACDTSRYNLYLNIAQLGILTVGTVVGTVIGVGKVCYSNVVQNYNPDYGYAKGSCLRNCCISALCCCWSRERIEAHRIPYDHTDIVAVPLQNNSSASAASGNLQAGLLGAPVNNNVFNLSGGNPSGHPSHIFNLGNTNTVHSTGLKSKKQLANNKSANLLYQSQQDDVVIDINDKIHSRPSASVSNSSAADPAHSHVDIHNSTNDHVVDVKDSNDNNDNEKAEISVEN